MPNTIEKADTSKNKEMLKDLKTKRSSIKGQITKFKKYLNIISQKLELSNIELVELNLKLSKFEALSVKFDDLQSEIEVLNSENIDAEIDEREGIDSDILSYLAAAKTLYQQHSQSETDLRRASVGHESLCTHDHQEAGHVVNFQHQDKHQVILSTALVEICNPITGSKRVVRALLDCGSQSFIYNRIFDAKAAIGLCQHRFFERYRHW
ncbi:hypothetical protein ACJJTC_018232 [Scirpophaga incertulas]